VCDYQQVHCHLHGVRAEFHPKITIPVCFCCRAGSKGAREASAATAEVGGAPCAEVVRVADAYEPEVGAEPAAKEEP
jgi:hypothetical protein